ncbi:MAG TPA: response regulator [Alphaproteobacteria bacterium]|nr:response regulator [Alphaproteobacteria bacterium]HNS43631.1 response regulator [Alphaproteobacteria bacterium]
MSQDKKILVVEDNDFVRMQIVRYLEEHGYGILEATDGIKAQELLTPQISLIILDIRMMPMDGFEFTKAIRGRYRTLPIIMVTGDQNPDLLNEASKWNVSAVLMKPVQKDRLVKMVERALLQAEKADR